jgi:hypothetical protein
LRADVLVPMADRFDKEGDMKSVVIGALIGAVLGVAGLDTRAAQAAGACTAYEDRDFGGKAFDLAADGVARKSHIANKISSFKMVRGCHVDAYTDDDFKGAKHRWSQDIRFVGRDWNDAISSWKCICGN